jgi:hypothetical protein
MSRLSSNDAGVIGRFLFAFSQFRPVRTYRYCSFSPFEILERFVAPAPTIIRIIV